MPRKRTGTPHSKQEDFAYWSAYTERSKSIAVYTDILKEADQHSIAQVANFTKRVENFYLGILIGFIAALTIVILAFIISTMLVLSESTNDFQRAVGTVGLPISLIILLLLLYKAPLKSARQIIGEIIKMQIIYLGYLRQVNQIDIGFKQTFVATQKTTPKQFQDTFTQTQKIIESALDEINLLLEDLG